jgi:uncharacterized protein (TIGR00251 family)
VGVGAWQPSERDGAVTFEVIVQPRASRAGVGPVVGDRLRVAVSAPPVDGKANEAVVRVLSEALGVARSAIEIVRGETGRRKTIRVRGVGMARVLAMAVPAR